MLGNFFIPKYAVRLGRGIWKENLERVHKNEVSAIAGACAKGPFASRFQQSRKFKFRFADKKNTILIRAEDNVLLYCIQFLISLLLKVMEYPEEKKNIISLSYMIQLYKIWFPYTPLSGNFS